MCSQNCPVAINTGEFIKVLRKKQNSNIANSISNVIANNYGLSLSLGRMALRGVNFVESIVGSKTIEYSNSIIRSITPRGFIPQWNKYFPLPPTYPTITTNQIKKDSKNKIVYFPTCISRVMGPSRGDMFQKSTFETTIELLEKANYDVVIPKNIDNLCCGLSFSSKAFVDANDLKIDELLKSLMEISEGGTYPILCDTSPCALHIRKAIQLCSDSEYSVLGLSVYEPVQFISLFLDEKKLDWSKKFDNILLHSPCSTKQMHLHSKMESIAKKCSKNVIDSNVPCCGMAGDRGMRYPELGDSSCYPMKRQISNNDSTPIQQGFSTSRTCEIQMANQSSVHFGSLIHLVNECTLPKEITK